VKPEEPPASRATILVIASPSGSTASLSVPIGGLSLQALERAAIAFALERHSGNRTRAARFLHLSRSALLYRMRKYRLDIPPTRSDTPGSKDEPL
jgi:DNA-binding NtrC family response regulator